MTIIFITITKERTTMKPIYDVNKNNYPGKTLFSIENLLDIYLIGSVILPLIITYAFLAA
tara:strand:- start:255 stop:434 length:180 start_codon:yes stop_codon:yes gene_type:complete